MSTEDYKDTFVSPVKMVEAGFPDLDFQGEVVEVKVIPYRYNNKTDNKGNFYPWTWSVQFDYRPDDDEPKTDIISKWYSIVTKNDGFENFRAIDELGEMIQLPEDLEEMREEPWKYGGIRLRYIGEDESWDGFTKNTTWWEFAGHLMQKGVIIEEDQKDYTAFLGIYGQWHDIPQADRGYKEKSSKVNKILVLGELFEHRKVKADSKARTATSADVEITEGGDDLKDRLFDLINDKVPDGGSLSMGKVSVLIAQNFSGGERGEARKAAADGSSFWSEFGLECEDGQVSLAT